MTEHIFPLSEDVQSTLMALGEALHRQNSLCATAESCTGGLLGSAITAVSGASLWFAGSVVAYANHVKMNVLGVSEQILLKDGAVSEACVCAMAEGVCRTLRVQVGVSVSGVAGPSGGTAQKPVGTVWLGFCVHGTTDALLLQLSGSRDQIRAEASVQALQALYQRVRA